ncbi:nucleolar protein 9 [Catharus ustulatus]|uniref:nucleolar protein 9 n=1 Tax=Catharus ustulatus TaxID=91951 RepID=UPI001409039C|nr:nucleolar protein 9 [Catharus ustulatus]
MAAHAAAPAGPGLSRQRRQSVPRLDPDTAEYFRRALEMLEEGLSEEELALFVPAVLSEAASAPPQILAVSPGPSRLLLRLLPLSPELLEGLVGEVGKDLGGLARDPNGSFVLRALLGVLGGTGDKVPDPEGAEPKKKWAWPALEGEEPKPKGAELPAWFRPLLEELAQGLEKEMPALLSPACASLCLQGALSALHRSQSPACSRFCRALIGCLGQDSPAHGHSPLLTSLQDPARSRLLEAAMTALDPQGLRELFRGHLKGHVRGVASHRVANHGLQRLLDHAPEDVVSEVLSELGPALEEPLARGHPGVLIALLGAAQRHPRLQGDALRWLFQALRCWAPPKHPQCVAALAQLRPLGGGAEDQEGAEPEPLPAVSLWGSLALQLLLRFRDPSPIWGSLLALPPPALPALARSPPGSRLWERILDSPNVPGSARKRLLRRLQGHWALLARDRSGSRVLDAAWTGSDVIQRAKMAAELAPHLQELLRDPHGRGAARNLGLEFFLRDRGGWERLQRGEGRRGRGLGL